MNEDRLDKDHMNEDHLDKDRVEGASKQTRGSIKEAIGKVTGNTRIQVEGKAETVAGQAQSTRGEASDAARDTRNT